MHFEIIGTISDVETIATGPSVKIRALLRKRYGGQRWRKLKGVATVRLWDGTIRLAEVHWFEAHGIGKKNANQALRRLERHEQEIELGNKICGLHRF